MPTKIADMTLNPDPPPGTFVPSYAPGQSGAAANPGLGKDGLIALVGKVEGQGVAAGNSRTIVKADLGKTITLRGSGSTISFSATAMGAGFWISIWNKTGATFTVPTPTGATMDWGSRSGHTKISVGGRATLTLLSENGTLYCLVDGETEA